MVILTKFQKLFQNMVILKLFPKTIAKCFFFFAQIKSNRSLYGEQSTLRLNFSSYFPSLFRNLHKISFCEVTLDFECCFVKFNVQQTPQSPEIYKSNN